MAGHWDQFRAPRHVQSKASLGTPWHGWVAARESRGCGSWASTAREKEAMGGPLASPSAQRHLGDIWDGLCSEGHSCTTGSPSQFQGNNPYSYKFTVRPFALRNLPLPSLCHAASSALSTSKAIPSCSPRISACCLQNKPAGKVNTGSIRKGNLSRKPGANQGSLSHCRDTALLKSHLAAADFPEQASLLLTPAWRGN